jgi:hypothetical protein
VDRVAGGVVMSGYGGWDRANAKPLFDRVTKAMGIHRLLSWAVSWEWLDRRYHRRELGHKVDVRGMYDVTWRECSCGKHWSSR